jgi:hypothetical protein
MQIPANLAQTIVDSRAYAAGDPVDEAFRTIRAEMPLAVAEPEGMEPFLGGQPPCGHHDGRKAAGHFPQWRQIDLPDLKEMEPMVRFITGGEPNLVRSLVSLDGQEHKDLRAVVFPSVTPKALRGLEDDIRKIAKILRRGNA